MKKKISIVLLILALLLPGACAEKAKCKESIPMIYSDARDFSEGLAAVRIDWKWGYINKSGQMVIEPKYDFGKLISDSALYGETTSDFIDGLALVSLNGRWGFINKEGEEVVPCKYNEAWCFSEGLAAVRMGYEWGFVDKTGREVVPPTYDQVSDFSGGIAAVAISGKLDTYSDEEKHVFPYRYVGFKWGLIDTNGKEVIPDDSIKYRYKAIEQDEAVIVPPGKYSNIDKASEGLIVVSVGLYPNQKYGFINMEGTEVVPLKYRWVRSFHEGMAAVCLNQEQYGEWGFIDKEGREITEFTYLSVEDFSEGYAVVHTGDWKTGKRGLIDKTGQPIIPCEYDRMNSVKEGMAAVSKSGKWGFIEVNPA